VLTHSVVDFMLFRSPEQENRNSKSPSRSPAADGE